MFQISFHKRERDSIRHETPLPNVIGPENLKNIQTLMIEAIADETSSIDEVHRKIIQHKFAELLPTLTKDFEVNSFLEHFFFMRVSSILFENC